MTLERAALPIFANHQTFQPRFGWIKKGYDAALQQPAIFNEQYAPVELGVGKNMVEAIRFWTLAVRVITRLPHPDKPRQSVYVPTKLGVSLFDDEFGLDPYIEDPTTLWMLHWQALSSPSVLPVWRTTFNDFTPTEFNEEALFEFCIDEITATTWKQPKPSSVGKDVDCLLRMYTRREARARQTLDELLDSPFRDLGLIAPSPSGDKSYRFVRGPKSSLTPAAIVYACIDFMSREGHTSASTTRLAVDSGSPGRLFKIGEDDIIEALETTVGHVGGLSLSRPAGAVQLVLEQQHQIAALGVLNAHHKRRGRGVADIDKLVLTGANAHDPAIESIELAELLFTSNSSRSQKARQGALL